MLPLHAHDKEFRPGWRIKERLSGWIRLIFADQNSRNLFLFLLLNLSMAFVELFYGVLTNWISWNCVIVIVHFLVHFLVADITPEFPLLAGLVASLISRWRPNNKFPYGYVRAEILAGFINGLFLIFISFFIFSEAVERIFEPPEIHHERLFVVSVMGFLVNIVGIFVFQHGGSHHGHSHGGAGHGHSHGGGHSQTPSVGHGHSHATAAVGHGHSHSSGACGGHEHSHAESEHGGHGHSHNDSKSHGHSHSAGSKCNHVEEMESDGCHDDHSKSPPETKIKGTQNKILEGVFLHILADTLGSVGVIISSVLIHYFGWMIADPICSVFIAALIGMSVIPLLRDSLGVLMQRQPKELDDILPGCFHKVSQLEGVYSVQEPHFWTLCSDVYIGGLKLEVAPGADTKYILSHTHNIFTAVGVRQLYVQIDVSPI